MKLKIKLVEDLYDKLSPNLQREIDQDQTFREEIKKDKVSNKLAALAKNSTDIEHILLFGDVKEGTDIWRELIQKYLDNLGLKLSDNAKARLMSKLSHESPQDVISGNSSFLEFFKNIKEKEIELDDNVLYLIDDLYKSRDISDLDLKSSTSWLFEDNIYKEESVDDQIYKIKLHVFLDNSKNVAKFKNKNGDSLPSELSNWEEAVTKSTKDLKRLYAAYTSDIADAEEAAERKANRDHISLEYFIKQLLDKTKNNTDPWTEQNFRDKLIDIILNSGHPNAKTLGALFKDIVYKDRDRFQSMLKSLKIKDYLDIISNENDAKEFVDNLQEYISKEIDLSANTEQKVAQEKLVQGTRYKVKDALKLSGYNPDEIYGFLSSKVLAYDRKRGGMTDYLKPFKTLFKNNQLVRNLLNADIPVNKNGSFDWTPFIIRYLSNIKLPKNN